MADAPRAGDRVEHLEIEDAWLIDPLSDRQGIATVHIEGGRIASISWARSRRGPRSAEIVVTPPLVDIHAHFREPGFEDAETIETGAIAAAHGGFGTVCLMANTNPPIDSAGVLDWILSRARAIGTPVRILAYGATTLGRAGEALAPMGELADAGAVGFSDDGSPVSDAALFRNALAYSGAVGRPVVEHAESTALTKGAEANEGLVATILGLKGWPVAGEESAVARALTLLDEVTRSAPADAVPRLHLTHVSTAGSLDLIRVAKGAGLRVTCDVTPHHLAFHEGWVAGDRRFAWEAAASPWVGGQAEAEPYDTATKVNPPLRAPADALALWAGLADGTVDAIATDHAPHTQVDKLVEFGDASNGISGIETALGLVLAGVGAGLVELAVAIRALTVGPLRVIAPAQPVRRGAARARGRPGPSREPANGFADGAPANLLVFDRADGWTVTGESLRSKGKNSPMLGRRLAGRVLATVVDGRFAWVDAGEPDGGSGS